MSVNRIKHNLRGKLNEEASDSRINSIKTFVKWCQEYLKLSKVPKIQLTNDKTKTDTYAHHDMVNDEILVYVKNRSLGDIMRSLAHELVHHQQQQNGKLTDSNAEGATGSDIENEANALAGIIMRDYGKDNPNIFESK